MDHQIKRFGALMLAGLALTICFPGKSIAQSKSMTDFEGLSFTSSNTLVTETGVSFELQFETENLLLTGQAESSLKGYEHLELLSFEALPDMENLMKIQGYLIDTKSQRKLLWTKAFNFEISPRDTTLISGHYVQFAAYNKLVNAERGLAFFDAFDLDIVYVGNMYKLVMPYERQTFLQAKEKYQDYDLWRVDYEGVQVVKQAQPKVLISSTPKLDPSSLRASLNE